MDKEMPHSIQFSELRLQAEESLAKSRNDVATMSPDELQNLVQELQAHQVELTLQNAELQKAQTDLAAAYERAERYLEVAAVMFVGLAADGTVTLVNPKACEILGYRREEILNKDWFECFIPEPVRKKARSVFDQIVAGRRKGVEFSESPVLTKSGGERIIQWHSVELRDAEGQITGVLDSGADITDKKKHESEVRRLQKEIVDAAALEQGRIGRELHDDAGQDLRGYAFLAGALSRLLEAGGHEAEAQDAWRLKKGLLDVLRKIRGLAKGLIAADIGEKALSDTLSDLARETQIRYHVDCKFVSSPHVSLPDHGLRAQLYRIVQEAVSNAVQHASPTHIEIRLTDSPQFTSLSVRDDGIGFVTDGPSAQGLGMRIMRHRAELIGGMLTVESEPGSGTIVTCLLSAHN